jgi:hypothetical protein
LAFQGVTCSRKRKIDAKGGYASIAGSITLGRSAAIVTFSMIAA